MIDLDTKVSRISSAASRDIAGEIIILSARDSMLHSLDEVGSVIWNLIEQPIAVKEIVARLLDDYDVERNVLEKDVIEFLNELMERKLIQQVGGSG